MLVSAWFPRDVSYYDDLFVLFQQNLLFQVLDVCYVVLLEYVVQLLVHVVHVLVNVGHLYELFHVSY